MRATEMTEAADVLATRGWGGRAGPWDVPTHAQALRFSPPVRAPPPPATAAAPVWEVRPRPLGGTFAARRPRPAAHRRAVPPRPGGPGLPVRGPPGRRRRRLPGASRRHEALAALRRRPDGTRAEADLRRPLWSWPTPAVFSKGGGSPPAVPSPEGVREVAASAPAAGLLGRPLRWRPDNLVPAAPAALAFTEALASAEPARVRLTPGDVLLLDNHRTLHGRAPFADTRRLLFRVRLWSR